MKRTILVLTQIAATVVFALLTAPSAHAIFPSRTWVASNGLDTNPCSRVSPCATFSHALSVTAAFGEINCIDAGNFGTVNIFQAVTISCEGGTAGILGGVAGVSGVLVEVTETDTVYLKGLDIAVAGSNSGAAVGISFASAGTLHIENCHIHGPSNLVGGFTDGIVAEPSGKASLFVSDTVLADNGNATGGANLLVTPGTNASLINVVLKNVRMEGGAAGLQITDNASTTIHAMIDGSLAAGTLGDGFLASTTGGRVTMLIDHSTAANNGQNGIEAVGANVEIDVGNSRIYGNAGSTAISGGGPTLLSFGNNEIIGNGRNAAITTTSTQ